MPFLFERTCFPGQETCCFILMLLPLVFRFDSGISIADFCQAASPITSTSTTHSCGYAQARPAAGWCSGNLHFCHHCPRWWISAAACRTFDTQLEEAAVQSGAGFDGNTPVTLPFLAPATLARHWVFSHVVRELQNTTLMWSVRIAPLTSYLVQPPA